MAHISGNFDSHELQYYPFFQSVNGPARNASSARNAVSTAGWVTIREGLPHRSRAISRAMWLASIFEILYTTSVTRII